MQVSLLLIDLGVAWGERRGGGGLQNPTSTDSEYTNGSVHMRSISQNKPLYVVPLFGQTTTISQEIICTENHVARVWSKFKPSLENVFFFILYSKAVISNYCSTRNSTFSQHCSNNILLLGYSAGLFLLIRTYFEHISLRVVFLQWVFSMILTNSEFTFPKNHANLKFDITITD